MALNPLRVAGILFDLDNTLFDREAAFDTWVRRFIASHRWQGDADPDDLLAWTKERDSDGYSSKRAVYETLLQKSAEPKADQPDSEEFYQAFFDSIALSDDVVKMLNAISLKSLPMGIVTNGGKWQWEKIERLNVRNWTNVIVVSNTFGQNKPAAPIFAHASELLGLAPKNILFVGDNPECDIAGASRVGMQTLWISRGQPWPSSLDHNFVNCEVENIAEMSAFVTKMLLSIR